MWQKKKKQHQDLFANERTQEIISDGNIKDEIQAGSGRGCFFLKTPQEATPLFPCKRTLSVLSGEFSGQVEP